MSGSWEILTASDFNNWSSMAWKDSKSWIEEGPMAMVHCRHEGTPHMSRIVAHSRRISSKQNAFVTPMLPAESFATTDTC